MSVFNSSNGVSSDSSDEVYSTEETRIGTWIDGKPLYRITFSNTTSSAPGPKLVLELASIDRLVKAYGVVYSVGDNSADDWVIPNGTIYINKNKDGLGINAYVADNPDWLGRPFVTTIEYTKTTDSASK